MESNSTRSRYQGPGQVTSETEHWQICGSVVMVFFFAQSEFVFNLHMARRRRMNAKLMPCPEALEHVFLLSASRSSEKQFQKLLIIVM